MLSDTTHRNRPKEAARKALQEFANSINPEMGELKKAIRIQQGTCYKSDLAWLFEVSERTVDAWDIQPKQKSPGRNNLYDVDDVFSQLNK